MRNEVYSSASPAVLTDYEGEMERFEIEPVPGSALPDVADFLHRWRATEVADSSVPRGIQEEPRQIERRLRWLLLENPLAKEVSGHGYCLRDRQGTIRGLTLTCPSAFWREDKRLFGLSAGSLFVEPPARSMGFYLFRKYLASPGYAFFFATTCNASSAGLWKGLGGHAIPEYDCEYFLPFRLDVMLPSFAATRTSNRLANGTARLAGQCLNPVMSLLSKRSPELAAEPCEDWDKLADLARRHRRANSIASDRTAEYLQWRYGPGSPHHPFGIYLFRDTRGNEGWFSLSRVIRGEREQIRGAVLLDVVWPREKIDFKSVFHTAVRLAAPEADALFFQPRPGADYGKYSRWAVPRRLEAPRGFAIGRKGAPRLALDSFDFDDVDYTAWKFQWK